MSNEIPTAIAFAKTFELGRPSRRSLLAGTILSLLWSATGTDKASAYRGWCRVDPQFLIAGDLALITISAKVGSIAEARQLSTGPIKLVLTVPNGTDARYLASNNGFGHGFEVVVAFSNELQAIDNGIPVTVDVLVPMKESTIPVLVSFAPAGSAVQSRVDEMTDNGATPGRNSGQLTAGSITGMANDWIVLTT